MSRARVTLLSLLPCCLLGGAGAQDATACPVPSLTPSRIAVGTHVVQRDGTLRVSVCVSAPATRRVASYHGVLSWNAAAPVLAVEAPAGRLHAENGAVPGALDFAGVAPGGLHSDALVTVIVRGDVVSDLGTPTLRLLELNDVAGASLLADARIDSLVGTADESRGPCGRRARVGRPQLERVTPATVDRTAASVSLELLGCGFDSSNVVTAGPRRVAEVHATASGTRLRVTLPVAEPGGGEVVPMPARAGAWPVVVSNAHGRSNALVLLVQ